MLVRDALRPWEDVQFLTSDSAPFGFPRRQFVRRPDAFKALLHPDDLKRVARLPLRFPNGKPVSWNFRVRHADGRYRRWYEAVRLLPSKNGNGAKLISCVVRMTGRAPAPQLRARVRERLDGYLQAVAMGVVTTPTGPAAHWPLLVQHSPVAMMLVKLTGEIIYSNPALRRNHGGKLAGARTMAAFVEAAHADRAVRARLLTYWRDEVVARASCQRELAVFRSPVEGVGGTHEIVFHWIMSGGMVVVTLEDITQFRRVELALRNSQERLSYALHGANDGIWDWNLATDAVYYSPRWKEMLGYADHEVENHLSAWSRLVHPEDREAVLKQAAAFMAGLTARHEVEFRMRHKAGHWVDILARGILIRNAQGRPQRMVGTHMDITARREAERQLREVQAQLEQRVRDRTAELLAARTRLETLLHAAPAGIVIHDAAGRIVLTNNTARRILCLTEQEAAGGGIDRTGWRFLREDGTAIPPEEHPVPQVLAARQGRAGRIVGVQSPRLAEAVWLYANAEPSFDELGRLSEVVISFMDITSRLKAERARDEHLQLLQNIINSSADMIFVKDCELRTVLCNTAFAQAVGKQPADLYGRTDIENGWNPDLVKGDPARRIRGFETDDRAALAGQIVRNPCDPANVGGEIRFFDTIKLPLRNAAGEVVGLLAVCRDITDRQKMEAALQESEERLRLALVAANQGFYDLNVQTGECVVSPEYATMLGYDPAVFRETNAAWIERLHPDDREAVAKYYQEYVAGLCPAYAVEFRQRTRDGDWKWILSFGKIVSYTADGRPLRMLGTHTDITGRKRAETELRESEAKHRQLIEGMMDAYSRVDGNGRFIQTNAAFQDLLGYSETELRGLTYYDITPEAWHVTDDRIRQEQVRARGYSDVYEKEYRRKDGAVFPIEIRTFLTRDEAGRPTGMWSIVRDITIRKRIETELRRLNESLEECVTQRTAALKESEARFRQLAEATIEGIVFSQAGVVTDSNTQFAAMFGYEPDEVAGRPVIDFIAPESRAMVAERVRSGAIEPCEFTGLRKDGTVFPGAAHVRTTQRDGRSCRITVLRDLTEIREATAELERQRIELARAQRLAELSEVSAGVIHQIGQPFTAIINNVSAAKSMVSRCTNQHCRASAMLLDTEASLKLVHTTMSRLRALAHPERVRRELRDVNLLVAEVVHLLAPEARPLGIQLRLDLKPDLPPASVDDVQLGQAILNLLRNACDAVASCEPARRQITVITRQDDHTQLLVEVSDRGAGIPPPVLTRLFEPFFTTKPNGTGVGLRLCRTIVTAHGGTLTARNNESGPGATFQISLPAYAEGKP